MEDRGSAKNDQKQLKVKQSRQLECTCGLFPAKAGTKRFRPMAGLVACVFYLILECTCFWPQTDKVYLFLAANLKNNVKLKQIEEIKKRKYIVGHFNFPYFVFPAVIFRRRLNSYIVWG